MTDLAARHHDGPLDDDARRVLGEQELELRLVANTDETAARHWNQAVARGFLDSELTEVQQSAWFERQTQRRLLGVYDTAAPDPDRPVATFASWVTELSVPGGRGIPAAAISTVTVAPTHRRRGVLRSMMTGELRRAHAAGVPVAVLTVSESTIYGRFGFAAAAMSGQLKIDVRRGRWSGPCPDGRIDFITRERFREIAPELHDRVRLDQPGEIEMPVGHWDRFAGTRPDAEKPERLRAVQYTDTEGALRGVALYAYEENDDDFARSKVQIHRLIAETPDAYAALWRFLLELDLVAELTASEQSVEEPVLWMISDRRAAHLWVGDHQWVRILDVPAALAARRYPASGRIALEVTDPLGIAAGRWLLDIDAAGEATVSADVPDDVPVVRLGVTELSAVYLGSVSLATLAAAGRVEADDGVAAAALLSWPVPARLSFWY
ncbi:GNAT family N-acetyltransferase [Microbacterium sp. AZCO]|uniref:GNAT family N-acetyltransferase n=1 Tax=Microbacterium sp. AZCO TaxID=3142976 RepID=UPI0031F3B8A6